MSLERIRYRADIDGLRAIAVLTVILCHARISGFTGGFVGVDVFFVISGYLITQFLLGEIQKTGTLSLMNFYARRIRRLFPAMIVVLVATIGLWLKFAVGVPETTNGFVESVRMSVVGFANMHFVGHTGGYFDEVSNEQPLLHFWSLAVEEQFYFLWPFLLLVSQLNFQAFRFSKFQSPAAPIRSNQRPLLFMTLFIVFGSIAYAQMQLSAGNFNNAYFLMPARMFELGAGALLLFLREPFVRWMEKQNSKNLLAEIFPLIGFFLIGFAVIQFSEVTPFPVPGALVPVLGAMILILSGELQIPTMVKRVLENRFMVQLGLISYGWYLWHWPLLAIAKIWFLGELPPLSLRCTIIVLSGVLAYLSVIWIETPVRHGKFFSNLKPYKVLLAGLLCVFVIRENVPKVRDFEKSGMAEREDFSALVKERTELASDCVNTGKNQVDLDKCTRSFAQARANPINLYTWGNSHAFSFFPMVESYAESRQLSATLASDTLAELGLLFSEDYVSADPGRFDKMLQFHESVFENIQNRIQIRKEKISVILASRWMYASGQQAISLPDGTRFLDKDKSLDGTRTVIRKSLVKTIENLNKIGVYRILILLPYPEFRHQVLRCFLRNPDLCATPRQEMESYRREMVNLLKQATGPFANVRLADPLPYLCSEHTCSQVLRIDRRDVPVVFDDDHPSVAAAKFLSQKMQQDLDWVAGQNTIPEN